MTKETGGDLVKDVEYSMGLVGSVLRAIVLFTGSFGITYSHIVWYQSEFLALEIRAAGSAIATGSCWVANLVVSVTYLTELETLTAAGTYGLYFGFILVGYVFVYFCYPETSESLTASPWRDADHDRGLVHRRNPGHLFERFRSQEGTSDAAGEARTCQRQTTRTSRPHVHGGRHPARGTQNHVSSQHPCESSLLHPNPSRDALKQIAFEKAGQKSMRVEEDAAGKARA
jgi:SP family myo-inositol transporter-like MFS transporter 13